MEDFAQDAADALRADAPALAFRLATLAVEANPRDARALNVRAMAGIGLRRYADAARDAEAALALAPDSAAVRQTRVRAWIGLGRHREALAEIDAALRRDSADAYAHQNKADVLAALGDQAGALESLRRSAALDPRFEARLQRVLPPPPRVAARHRALGLAALAASGGLLVALAVLNVVSAARRARVRRPVS